MKDLMLDMETLSTRPNAAILSIGAVVFDPYGQDYDGETGEIGIDEGRLFYINVDLEGQVEEYGRHVCASTIMWWLQQEKAARLALAQNRQALPAALNEYALFCRRWGVERVWGYGATADNVWIESAMQAVGLANPVNYRGQRCLRTLADLFPVGTYCTPGGVAHNALHDALNQVVHLQRIFKLFPKETANAEAA